MSQYSEMMGSFIRTGDYPMEANYIFSSEEELKAFYADELNNTTLHKGLLKVVSSGDSQTLYWVIEVGGELQFKPLIQEGSIDKLFDRLAQIRNDLNQEISDRKNSILEIVGTDDMSEFHNQLDNLLAISNAVVDLQKQSAEHSNILSAIVGTEEENILEYLKSLDYNNLSDISNLLHKFFDMVDDSDSQINTLPELQKFLRGFDYTHNLYQHLRDLWNEIQGTPTPSTTFRTLRGVQDFVETLASVSNNRDDNFQTELDQTQVGVGLSGDGSFSPDQETNYLKSATSVMNALKTLDGLIAQALRTSKLIPTETNTVSITVDEDVKSSNISANVKVSNGSDIIVNNDGLYTKLSTEYENGILTIKVNGNIRSQHALAIPPIIDNLTSTSTTSALSANQGRVLKENIDNLKTSLSAVYIYKGSVDTYDALPTEVAIGDTYNVVAAHGSTPAGTNYAWNGKSWDPLGGSVDLSSYYTKSEADKAISGAVSKVSEDVSTLKESVAQNTSALNVLNGTEETAGSLANTLKIAKDYTNTQLTGYVAKVEGSSLISEEKLALIDTNATSIAALKAKVEANAAALATLNGDASTSGSVTNTVNLAINSALEWDEI